jgi:hypothetical protein
MSMNRINQVGNIVVALAMTLGNAALAASNAQEYSHWYGAYGWEWDKIPPGTKIRVLVKLEQPTYLYHERKDGTSFASLPEGQLGEYLGNTKDGWVQIKTKQGTGWVDYRLLEPAVSEK